jgi:serine/threonine protein kinase
MGDDPGADAGLSAGIADGFAAGARVGGYRLEQQLGRGGMAVVYLARDERLDRLVALKILAPALAEDEAFRKRFIRESRAAAAVDDPHIIPVFDAGQAGGMLYIAMRYVPGGDVRTICTGMARCRRGGRRRSSRRWPRRWMPRTPPGWSTVMSSRRTCWSTRGLAGLTMCTCLISG